MIRSLLIATLLLVAAPEPPELTQPVNDFAKVIDRDSAAQMDQLIRALQAASGDTVAVVTVPSLEGYASIEEYAVKQFQNHGRGIGQKGKNNGVLIVVAPNDRKMRIEVGYDLEQWITDGYAGETIREFMAPEFRRGFFGAGLLAATTRIVDRIARERGVELQNVPRPARARRGSGEGIPLWLIVVVFILVVLLSRGGGGPGQVSRYWGRRSGWSGWSSGVGPFGGGGGWSSGGGGFGGGFGGFGGGSSGGGGASGSW